MFGNNTFFSFFFKSTKHTNIISINSLHYFFCCYFCVIGEMLQINFTIWDGRFISFCIYKIVKLRVKFYTPNDVKDLIKLKIFAIFLYFLQNAHNHTNISEKNVQNGCVKVNVRSFFVWVFFYLIEMWLVLLTFVKSGCVADALKLSTTC